MGKADKAGMADTADIKADIPYNIEEIPLEQVFSMLEEILKTLESEELPLEQSFKEYMEGMSLIKVCNDKIDKVEKAVLQLNENGDLDEFCE